MQEVLIESKAQVLRRSLLAWYRRRARALPWRRRRDPYAIWVSEVMLQQTQVTTVVPYFERFLRAFPTVRHLARAPQERVLRLWAGLGYYRRARDLHQAAQQLLLKWGGRFPRDERELRSLPGVGRYTARAILSIAFNHACSVLDGNVARVMARLTAWRGVSTTSACRHHLERQLDCLFSRRSPGNFNQALMELGQTVCLPRAPRCPACPLRAGCLAHQSGNAEAYPAPRPRRKAEVRYLASAVIRRAEKVALVRGLDEKLLTDLWNFPAAFGHSPLQALARLRRRLKQIPFCSIRLGPRLGELTHRITYRSIQVRLYAGEVIPRDAQVPFRWFPLGQVEGHAVSQLARKIAAKVREIPPAGPGPNSRG